MGIDYAMTCYYGQSTGDYASYWSNSQSSVEPGSTTRSTSSMRRQQLLEDLPRSLRARRQATLNAKLDGPVEAEETTTENLILESLREITCTQKTILAEGHLLTMALTVMPKLLKILQPMQIRINYAIVSMLSFCLSKCCSFMCMKFAVII